MLQEDEELATLKIEADVDMVAIGLLRRLRIPSPPPYDPATDELLIGATALLPGEPGREGSGSAAAAAASRVAHTATFE